MLKVMRYLIVLSLLFMPQAWAADNSAEQSTHISLTATASMLLPNDEVVVVYRIEASGSNSHILRKQVNGIGEAIRQTLSGVQGLKQRTLSRRMEALWRYDNTTGRQVRQGWKLVQSEQIISQKIDGVANWVDNIEQAGGKLNSLTFRISDQTMQTAQNSLRLQAVQTFRQKAAVMAKALDASSFSIVKLSSNQQQPIVRPQVMEGVAMVRKSAPPTLHTGEGKISVSVSGIIAVPIISYPVK